MSKISEVIENISKYGNCEIYYEDVNEVNFVISVKVDESGKIHATAYERKYENGLYWDGKKFNDKSFYKEVTKCKYNEESMIFWLLNIVMKSINEKDLLNMGIEAKKTPVSFSTDEATKKIYNKVNKMITNLSYKDYCKLCQIQGDGILYFYATKFRRDALPDEDIEADMASDLIEEKVQQVAAQFKEIYDLWLTIYFGMENYEEAKKEWAKLSVDETVPVEVGTKRQRQK